MIIPDCIAYPLITWGIAALWFNRHKLFGVGKDDLHASKKSSR
ncbi:hypothetical protein LXEBMM8_EKPBGFGD_00837 [Lactiplantibacillus xiangfangensis]